MSEDVHKYRAGSGFPQGVEIGTALTRTHRSFTFHAGGRYGLVPDGYLPAIMSDAPIRERILALRQELHDVCASCGRDDSRIKLIAVSKTRGAGEVEGAMAAGLSDFGENRVQEAKAKIDQVSPRPVWHLVGHLQTNKAQAAARLFDWVQSVDSAKVATALGRSALAADKKMGVLVQVNTTSEAQKSGCSPEALSGVLEAVSAQPALRLSGLMTIGPESMDECETRAAFELCARLRDQWRASLPEGAMDVLSMGMSGDWRWAVGSGADWIRIGAAIFGARA